MSFITDIYSEIETEFEGNSKKNHLSAFYTLINYIELIDNGSGLSEGELNKLFSQRKEYFHIIQKLIRHSVLEKSQEGLYKLNENAKEIISPIFDDLMSLAYKPNKKIKTNDATLKLLYNWRSQIFSS